jgi:hypothetical protein
MNSRRATKKTAGKAESTSNVVKLQKSPAAILGKGAHFARLYRKLSEGRYEAHTFDGERFEVRVAPEVDLALSERCLAEQDIVLIGAVGNEVLLFGALRTREKSAEEVVVEAPRKLVLRAGKSKIELSAEGKVKVSGQEMTVDAPREVRIASAHVEIP